MEQKNPRVEWLRDQSKTMPHKVDTVHTEHICYGETTGSNITSCSSKYRPGFTQLQQPSINQQFLHPLNDLQSLCCPHSGAGFIHLAGFWEEKRGLQVK